jgi:DNA-binding NarL/FixJ family response regulator
MKTVVFASAAAGANSFRLEEYYRTAEGVCVCSTCRTPIPTATLGIRTLSHRERQIVDLVCQARLNKEIAYELQLSEGTVKEYLYRLFKKVGVRNRTELAILALTRTLGVTRAATAA